MDGIPYLSPSQMAKFTSCERAWWFSRHGLREGTSEPLAMGGGFAAALEYVSLGRGLTEYGLRRPDPDGWTDEEMDVRAFTIGESIITHAFAGYTSRWPDPVDCVREETYLLNMPYAEGHLQVRVDGVVPGHHLIEDKLRGGTAMRGDAIENEVRQGRQLTAEAYAHWRVTGDLLPVHLRCVRKPDPRPLKTCELDEIDGIVEAHFEKEIAFQEFVASRTVDQLREFEGEFGDLDRRAAGIGSSSVPAGAKNEQSCHLYGRACPAIGYCQSMATWGPPA